MPERFAIGIDLGTSTCEVCVFRHGRAEPIPDPVTGNPVIPSLVALGEQGEVLVGEAAREAVDEPGRGVREAKRKMGTDRRILLGGEALRPQEVGALLLKHLRASAEAYLGQPVRQVVISVPANFDDKAKRATQDAAAIAGLEVLLMMAEPTAAALAWGIDHMAAEEQVLVFDFGGGTLDITILEMFAGVMDVRCSFGDPRLGGKDFDDAMVGLLKAKVQAAAPGAALSPSLRRDIKAVAEQAKIALTAAPQAEVTLHEVGTEAGGQPVSLDVRITRAEFEEACEGLLQRTRDCLLKALRSKDVRPSSIHRVLLIGGTSSIPAVQQVIEATLGRAGTQGIDPVLAVGMGAAIRAAQLTGLLDTTTGPLITDVAPMGIGVSVLAPSGGKPVVVYEALIPPNTPIPCQVRKTYHLLAPDQAHVPIQIFQDPTGTARVPSEAIALRTAVLRDVVPSRTGKPHQIELVMHYDPHGVLRMEAHIAATRQGIVIELRLTDAEMGPEEVQAATARMDARWAARPAGQPYRPLLERAERVLGGLEPAAGDPLRRAIEALTQSIAEGDEAACRRASSRLADLLSEMES